MERFLPRLRMPMARLWAILLFVMPSLAVMAQQPFITTWKTDNPGESITIPVNPDVTGYNYTVDWGDGNISTGQRGDAVHTYADARTYTVTISGSFPAIRLGKFGDEVSHKLMSIEQWGDMAWQSMEGAFSSAKYMVLNAGDVPNLSGVSSLARMFYGAELVNGNLSGWDVSSVTTMEAMFNGASAFNGDITGWNVSNVKNMSWMFWQASVFDQDIGGWTVTSVEDMSFMFYSAVDFNRDLSGWTTSSVTNMRSMFAYAMGFDQSLGSWDISRVTDMDDMLFVTGLSSANYGATLIGWAALPTVPSNITLDATGQEYCPGSAAETARQELDMKGWNIIGDDPATDCGGGGTAGAFITTWQTTNSGTSANDEITIPTTGGGYNYNVYWEKVDEAAVNGNETGVTGDLTITFPASGTYRVEITGDFPRIYFNNQGDKDKILSVEQWGAIQWDDMTGAFHGAANLVIGATDAPDLSGVAVLAGMFHGATSMNSPIGHWDVSTVTNMNSMFMQATSFDQDLNSWEVANVTNMASMFRGAERFNGNIANWDVSKVTTMFRMFRDATNVDQDLNGWAVSSVTDMASMFHGAEHFNGNIANWDVSNVTVMYSMFSGAANFNRDLGDWDISNVTNMNSMFQEAESFNGDIGSWNVSGVTDMTLLFRDASAFDRNLGDWDISAVTAMPNALNNAGLSRENYDATLIGWAEQANVPSGITLGAEGLSYCEGADARQQLIDDYGWDIQGDTEVEDCAGGGIGPADPDHFITVWNTEFDAGTGPYNIKIPATGEFTYTWVNINEPAVTGSGNGSGETIITFPQPGTYEVRMAPTGSTPFHSIRLHYRYVGNDAAKLLEVKNWGAVHWSRFMFYGCSNLKITATDIPDLSGVMDLSFAFSQSGIDEIPNINDWDVSNVTNLSSFLQDVTGFNQSLSDWNVSNVIDMGFMFDGATSFNQPLDTWDVSKVENISYMFRNATSFDQSLAAWQLESFDGGIASFYMSGMSCENFSYSLYSWATNPNTNDGAILGGSGVTYSPDVAPYVDKLRDERNWRFQLLQEGTCSVVLPDTPIEPDDNNILYVNINVGTDAPGGNGSGDSWENAIPELADALKWAREQHGGGNGWTETEPLRIFVAKGTYLPLYHAAAGQYTTDGGRDNSFVLVPNVQLYGGFDPLSGIETLEDARILPKLDENITGTVLNGDLLGNDVSDIPVADLTGHPSRADNAYSVVRFIHTNGNTLDGLTITGGAADLDHGNGGGLWLNESSPILNNLLITNNSAIYEGGGMYHSFSSPTLSHVIIHNNAAQTGGGIFNWESSPVLRDVTISSNKGETGGGMVNNNSCSPKLINVSIRDNIALEGGGMVNRYLASPILMNVAIVNNTASDNGGGISDHSSSGVFVNTTMAGNTPNAISAANGTRWINAIVWGSISGNIDAEHSLIEGNTATANGNINANDLTAEDIFVDPDNGDYALKASGPAINSGSNAAYADAGGNLMDDLDLGGNPRVYAGIPDPDRIDVGAYEFQGEPVPTVVLLTAPDVVTAVYGTALGDLADLPTTVTASLSDDTDVSVPLEGNTANWTLLQPLDGSYDGNVAGMYVFAVPLVLPEGGDDPYFTNPENLQAEVTVIVSKGVPVLAASWNGTTVDAGGGLSLTYGNVGELLLNTTDSDGVVTYSFGDGDAPVLDLADLSAVAAQQVGAATLTIEQEESDNYEAASIEIPVTVASKAVTVVPMADQGKIYGANEPAVYGYELADGDALAFDDELTDIVSAASRETGEDVGAYDIELVFGGDQAGNYEVTFEADNNAFTVTQLVITVTAENKSKVFGSDDPALTYTSAPELIGDDTFTGGLDREDGENVGTYNITQGNLSLNDNYEIGFEESTFTIIPAAYEGVEFNNGSFVYNGAEHVLELTGELPEGATVTYEIDGETGNAAIDAGTYEIIARIAGGDNYEDGELTATLTITPLEITVTAAEKTKAFGSDDPALTYTFAPEPVGDDAFTGELDREEGENVGSYAITQGNLSLSDNYAITFEEGTLTIRPADYEGVTFNNASFVYDGTEHVLELAGELPEGASVSYEIDGEAGNGATDAGAYAVTAIIDGGANYEDAELTATLTITPLEITVIVEDKSKAFGTDDPALTYTFTPELIDDDAFTGELTREEGEDVGSYAISQGNLSLDDNYEITFEEGTLTITPADISEIADIAFNDLSLTYDGTEHTLTLAGELPEGASVDYEIDGEAGNGATDAGAYAVTANIDGGANYEDAELTATLTITLLKIAVTAEDKTKAFGTDDPALTYTFTPALINDDVFTGELTREEGEDVGDYAITQGNLSLGDNYEVSFEESTLTITRADIGDIEGITFEDASFVYDGTEHVLELTGELRDGISVTYEIDGELGNGATDAGVYEVTANIDGGNNYEDTQLTATLTIIPLEITVTVEDKTKVYGTDDPALTYTFTPEPIGENAFTGDIAREEGEDVGAYAITQGTLSVSGNYEIAFEAGVLTITPSDIDEITEIEFNDGSVNYDGMEHVLELTGELPDGVSVTYEIDGESGNGATDAGTYEVIANIDGGDNYEDTELTATLTISPLEITVTAEDKTKVYGTDDPALTYTFTPELIDDDAFTGELTREEGEDVGGYAINQGELSAGSNYTITFNAGELTITPREITAIAFEDLSFTYDGTEHRLSLAGELPAGASVTYENNGRTTVGTQTVKAVIDGDGRYEDMVLEASLTVTPLEITVTADDKTKTFGDDDPRLTYTSAPEPVDDEAFTGSLDREEGEDVGEYIITQGELTAGDNYTVFFETGTLTITPAERTLDFPELPEKTYGDDDFDAGAEASTGEAIRYTSSNPNVAEVTDDGEIIIIGAGETTITATVPENANYSNRPQESQTLTVHKASQTITLDGPVEVNRDAGSIELTASSTSGLPVILVADNPEVATLEVETLSILRLGHVTITATQDGDTNYEAAEPVTLTIRVVDPTSDLPVRVHPVISPNGDGINEFLMIEAITDYPENRVTIFNRNGTLLWEASGYDNNRVAFRGISTGQLLLPAGTYFYIVEVKDDDTWKHKKGYFVLRY